MLEATTRHSESPVESWEDLSHELWQVQHGGGDPRLMTLDELDAAFKTKEVNGRTLVRRPGSLLWKTLGEIAGLESSGASVVALESDSLIPLSSEIELTSPKIPGPPPLPRRSRSSEITVNLKPVPAEAIVATTEYALSDDVLSDDVLSADVIPDSSEEDLSTAYREPALSHEELMVVRPPRMRGNLFGVAMVAVIGACVFGGVSAWLTGAFGASATETPVAAAAPPPPAAPADEPAAVATIAPVATEGSLLVFAPAAAARNIVPAPEPSVAAAPVAHAPAIAHAAAPAPHAHAPSAPHASTQIGAGPHPVFPHATAPHAPVVQQHAPLPTIGKTAEAKKGMATKRTVAPQLKAKSH